MSYLSLCGREWGGVGAYSRLGAYSNKYGKQVSVERGSIVVTVLKC